MAANGGGNVQQGGFWNSAGATYSASTQALLKSKSAYPSFQLEGTLLWLLLRQYTRHESVSVAGTEKWEGSEKLCTRTRVPQ